MNGGIMQTYQTKSGGGYFFAGLLLYARHAH